MTAAGSPDTLRKVIFFGVGAIGSSAATFCRGLPATLVLVDGDQVETGNLAAQAFTQQAVGRNKAEALQLQLRRFHGVDADAYPVRLDAGNVAELAAGADLLVDCFDNAASRRVLSGYARQTGVPLVHAGLDADGTFGLVRWDEGFTPDEEPSPGQATCAGGRHLPLISLLAATLARIIQDHLADGGRRGALVSLRAVTEDPP